MAAPDTPILAARMAAATAQRGPVTSPEAHAEATLQKRFPLHRRATVAWALRAANGHAGKAARTLRGTPAEEDSEDSEDSPAARSRGGVEAELPGALQAAVVTSDAELAALTALHSEVAALAESFGGELPDGLHEELESVEDQLAHVLDLSDMLQDDSGVSRSPGDATETLAPLHHAPAEAAPMTAAAEAAASPSSSLRGTKMGAAAEAATDTVMKTLLRKSAQLDSAVTVACVRTAGCSLQCPATNFGVDSALAIEGSVLAHCDPPLADVPLSAAAASALRGNLAVCRRGVVPVSAKAYRVQEAGAIGLILVNSDDLAWLPFVKTPTEIAAAEKTTIPIVIVPESAECILRAGASVSLFVRDFVLEASSPPAVLFEDPERGLKLQAATAVQRLEHLLSATGLPEPAPEPERGPESERPEPEPEPEPQSQPAYEDGEQWSAPASPTVQELAAASPRLARELIAQAQADAGLLDAEAQNAQARAVRAQATPPQRGSLGCL